MPIDLNPINANNFKLNKTIDNIDYSKNNVTKPEFKTDFDCLKQAGEIQKAKILASEVLLNPDFVNFQGLDEVLYSKIQSQLKTYTKEEIESIIEELINQGIEEKEAILTLNYLTQFASLKSMQKIADKLNDIKVSSFCSTSTITYNWLFEYFFNNKYRLLYEPFETGQQGYVLDKIGLEYLENHPDKLEELKNNPCVEFFVLEGWDEGLNIYNQGKDINSIAENAYQLAKTAQKISKEENIDFKEALKKACVLNIDQKTKKLGINNYTLISNQDNGCNADINSIIRNIAPNNITLKELRKILCETINNIATDNKIETLRLFCALLISQIDIYTPRKLGDELKKMHKLIIEKVNELKKSDGSQFEEDDIIYVIPKKYKSYSTIAMQYALVNDIDINKFQILYKPFLKNITKEKDKIYVILDDMMGSGASLIGDVYGLFEEDGFDESNHIILAPVLTNNQANSFAQAEFEQNKRGKLDFVISPQNPKTFLRSSLFWKNLSDKQQNEFYNVFYRNMALGLGGTGFAVAFPYMTPDNNFKYATPLLEKFMLNGNAIKNKYVNLEIV